MTDNNEKTTEFKVGDRVRVKSDRGFWAGVIGIVCEVNTDCIYFHEIDGERFKDGSVVWHEDGGHGFYRESLEYAPKPAQEPVQGQTGREVAPEVVERLIALCGAVARSELSGTLAEAQAIQALLEPVETDGTRAETIAASCDWDTGGDTVQAIDCIAQGIALGRNLERQAIKKEPKPYSPYDENGRFVP